jgi:hypothetical protein
MGYLRLVSAGVFGEMRQVLRGFSKAALRLGERVEGLVKIVVATRSRQRANLA